MEIKELKASDIKTLINSKEFLKMEDIPISSIRALSHIANPRLQENDVILLLAYIDGVFGGYLGALPDSIFFDKKEHHVAWLSCLWVSSKMRRKGVAVKLLSRANQLWKSQLLITNFTPQAKGSYDKLNVFTELKTFNGVRGYMKMDLHRLQPNKDPKYNKIKFLLHIFDFSSNLLIGIRLWLIKHKYAVKDLSVEFVDSIDNELKLFIERNNSHELTKRTSADLNWITKYPWLSETEINEGEAAKYEFSSVAKEFKLQNIKIYDKNKQLIAFVMMHIRNKHLKIPYVYFLHYNIDSLVKLIYNIMLKQNLSMLSVYNSKITEYISGHASPFFLKRKINRTYLIAKTLKSKIPNFDNISFQDGDGDSAFT